MELRGSVRPHPQTKDTATDTAGSTTPSRAPPGVRIRHWESPVPQLCTRVLNNNSQQSRKCIQNVPKTKQMSKQKKLDGKTNLNTTRRGKTGTKNSRASAQGSGPRPHQATCGDTGAWAALVNSHTLTLPFLFPWSCSTSLQLRGLTNRAVLRVQWHWKYFPSALSNSTVNNCFLLPLCNELKMKTSRVYFLQRSQP